ncbi:MAG TPA: hypothetical protein VK824_03765, partial [Planctomycetota bacterium]|nr:hypothetical protein [Planctomycetota bacterium]
MSATRSWRRLGSVLCGLAALVLGSAGCASPARAPFAPVLPELAFTQHAGTAITGPLDGAAIEALDPDPAHALVVEGRALLLEHVPRAQIEPLAGRTRLVLATPGSQPMLAAPQLGAGAGLVPAAQAAAFLAAADEGALGASIPLGDVRGALPQGVTAALHVTPAGAPWKRAVVLMLSRADAAGDASESGSSLSAALFLDGRAPEQDPDRSTGLLGGNGSDSAAAQTAAGAGAAEFADEVAAPLAPRSEGLLLHDAPRADGSPLVVVVPMPVEGHEDAALVLALRARPARDDEGPVQADAVADALRRVDEAAAAQRLAAAALTDDEAFLRGLLAALASLDVAGRQRSALVFLAGTSGAELAQDLALVGDKTTLRAYVERVHAEARTLGDPGERGTALGWLLERTAWRMFAAAADEGRLPPALLGLLLHHAGEVGRFPGTLDDVLSSCHGLAELRSRLIAENAQFLHDASPVSRVRAFDWLAWRGEAPAGFDPLGAPDARRAALAQHAGGAGTSPGASAGTDATDE